MRGRVSQLRAAARWAVQPEPLIAALLGLTVFALSSASVKGAGGHSIADVARPLRLLVLLGLLAHAVLVVRERPDRLRPLWPLVPLGLAIPISLLASDAATPEARDAVSYGLLVAVLFLLAPDIVASEARTRRLVCALAAVFGFVLVAMLVLPPFVDQLAATKGEHADPRRFRGILQSANSIGALGFVALPSFVAAWFVAGRARWRWACLAAGLLLCGEVAASGSRAGLAGLLAAMAVLFLIAGPGPARTRLLLAVAAVAVVALAVVAIPAANELLRLDRLADAGGRREVWPLVTRVAALDPVAGRGFGSSPAVFDSFGDVQGFSGHYSGNLELDILLELGVLGLIALALLLAVVAVRGIRWLVRRDPATFPIRLLALAWAVGGFVNAQAESFLLRPGGAGTPAFWLGAALICAAGAPAARRVALPRVPAPVLRWGPVVVLLPLLLALAAFGRCAGPVCTPGVDSAVAARDVQRATGIRLRPASREATKATVARLESRWAGRRGAATVLLLVFHRDRDTRALTGGKPDGVRGGVLMVRRGPLVVLVRQAPATPGLGAAIARALDRART